MTKRREKIFIENLGKIQKIARLYADIWDYKGFQEIFTSPNSNLAEQKLAFNVRFQKHEKDGAEFLDVVLYGKRLGYNFGKRLEDDCVEELAANILHRACFMYELNYQRRCYKNFLEKSSQNA